MKRIVFLAAISMLAACQPGGDDPASQPDAAAAGPVPDTVAGVMVPDADSSDAFAGIRPEDVLRFTGTEPFWGGQVSGDTLTYSTPEDQDGTEIAVERFAGRGGIAFSGELDGGPFEMMVTPLECSDGMSDRTYPFTVTLEVGGETRNGCGWTDAQPFEGPEHP